MAVFFPFRKERNKNDYQETMQTIIIINDREHGLSIILATSEIFACVSPDIATRSETMRFVLTNP